MTGFPLEYTPNLIRGGKTKNFVCFVVQGRIKKSPLGGKGGLDIVLGGECNQNPILIPPKISLSGPG